MHEFCSFLDTTLSFSFVIHVSYLSLFLYSVCKSDCMFVCQSSVLSDEVPLFLVEVKSLHSSTKTNLIYLTMIGE